MPLTDTAIRKSKAQAIAILRELEPLTGQGIPPSRMRAIAQRFGGMGLKATLRDFDRLKYPAPKEYGPAEIILLREKKLRMSQAAFALACNAKLSTLQKWESGVNRPTPPVNRLFQLIELGGLACLEGNKGSP